MYPAPEGLSVIDAPDGVVVVAGELDAASAGQLARRLAAPPSVRVIDLSGVTFIDASGLRALVEATSDAGANRRRLRSPSPPVVRLCEITGLTAMMQHTGGSG